MAQLAMLARFADGGRSARWAGHDLEGGGRWPRDVGVVEGRSGEKRRGVGGLFADDQQAVGAGAEEVLVSLVREGRRVDCVVACGERPGWGQAFVAGAGRF